MQQPPRERVALGDLVIVYEDFQNVSAVRVTQHGRFEGSFARFHHASIVGKRYGERVSAGGGTVHLLWPSPELWTASLPHRTQILYVADISMICLQLELLPGSRCLEAGTGSASLSHALARSVGASGHLYTYEFNAERAKLAAAEFDANGLRGHVTCRHGDVCSEGWGYEGIEHGSIDAAIFDLPQPWDAVRKVAPLLRPGGRLCTFSPCIEQVCVVGRWHRADHTLFPFLASHAFAHTPSRWRARSRCSPAAASRSTRCSRHSCRPMRSSRRTATRTTT